MSQSQLTNPFNVVDPPNPAEPGGLTRFTVAGRDGETLDFTGRLLGRDSSYQSHHTHDALRSAAKNEKCSACRWFEVAIYRRYLTEKIDLDTIPPAISAIEPEPGDYIVHTVGVSTVAGEQRLSRIASTDSAFEIIEFLTVRKVDKEPFITVQSSRALAQAAARDEDIRDAYINRALV